MSIEFLSYEEEQKKEARLKEKIKIVKAFLKITDDKIIASITSKF